MDRPQGRDRDPKVSPLHPPPPALRTCPWALPSGRVGASEPPMVAGELLGGLSPGSSSRGHHPSHVALSTQPPGSPGWGGFSSWRPAASGLGTAPRPPVLPVLSSWLTEGHPGKGPGREEKVLHF